MICICSQLMKLTSGKAAIATITARQIQRVSIGRKPRSAQVTPRQATATA